MPASGLPAAERLISIAGMLTAGLLPEPADAALAAMALVHLAREQRRQDAIALRRAGLAARDGHIRELGRQLPAPQRGSRASRNAHAGLVVDELRRYQLGRWRRDRGLLRCPEDIASTIEGICWHALKSAQRCPLSRKAVVAILYPSDT